MSPGVRRSSTDEGTILLLTLGLMAFLLLVVSTVVDVSAVFLARRDVTGSCDAAAVASAQTARRDRVYAGSTGDRLPLPAGFGPVTVRADSDAATPLR